MLSRQSPPTAPLPQGNIFIIGGMLALNLIFNIIGNAGFKLSALASNWRGFLGWQVAGNLAGFVTVLTLTGLLRYLPLHVAQPMTQGLAIIGVQIVAAKLFFHETIAPAQWIGILLIVGGIILIQK
jgi:multidrug transporter EmrE-like cation transporter